MAESKETLKIGINGFGRIGRMVLRASLARDDIEVVALNDPFISPEYMQYQFKYDSTQGTYKGEVEFTNASETAPGMLSVDGNKMTVFAERDPSKIDWTSAGCVYVAECTGIFKNVEKAKMHLGGSVKKVVVSAPNDGEMFVMGVNHKSYKPGTEVISNASCTTNGLAPLVKVLDEAFGIENGLMTTVHAVTATQNSIDGPNKKWRSGRGAYQNIIPATTGAAKAVGKVYTPVAGLLTGMAMRVPVPDGSVIDLVVNLKADTTVQEVNQAFATAASKGDMVGVMGYTEEQLVSSDIIGNSCSTIVDAKSTLAVGKRTFKIISWYDNEWGYSNRLCDLACYAYSQD
jgi:glyceraldehyde 3-phosphate dehydrogenase